MKTTFQRLLAAVSLLVFATGAGAQTVEYVHTDALGSPVAITNASGAVVERTVYEPYGAVVNRALSDGPGFTGHVTDSKTALVYMQQRYYDPSVGRFLSMDPVSVDGVAGGNFNRYEYAANNPYKYRDPDGRQERSPQGGDWKDTVFAPWGGWSSFKESARDFVCLNGCEWPGPDGPIGMLQAFGPTGGPLGGLNGAATGAERIVASSLGDIVPKAADHIVLGLRAFGLESTAAKVGGRTLLSDANWMQSLKTAIHTPGTRFTVSVEGLGGTGVRSQVMGSVQRGLGSAGGATDWELAQLYQAGRLGDVTFVNGAGAVLANPFK